MAICHEILHRRYTLRLIWRGRIKGLLCIRSPAAVATTLHEFPWSPGLFIHFRLSLGVWVSCSWPWRRLGERATAGCVASGTTWCPPSVPVRIPGQTWSLRGHTTRGSGLEERGKRREILKKKKKGILPVNRQRVGKCFCVFAPIKKHSIWSLSNSIVPHLFL